MIRLRPDNRPLWRLVAGLSVIVAAVVYLPVGQAGAGLPPDPNRAVRSSDEARVTGTCSRGASSSLRIKADDGRLRIRFRVNSTRRYGRWRVVLASESRIVFDSRVRADRGGSLRVGRRARDFPGADRVTARALGPGGITCIASATVLG